MRINQKELSAQEQELLIAVLDYSLTVGKTTFSFNKRKDYVKLDLSIPEMTRVRDLSEKQIKQLKDKIKELDRQLVTLCSQNAPESERADLISKIDNLKETIKNGKTITHLLGMFNPETRTIYLFLKNIDATGCRREALVSTFIHEMFHAWNYFAAGRKSRSVEEIDEPMVEFGMLYFLKNIASESPEFASIHDWALKSVRAKQDCTGITAAYGYGFYLYQLSFSDQKEKVLRILAAYGKKSSVILNTDNLDSYAVQYLKGLLSPLYHHDKESDILDLLDNFINNNDYYLFEYIAQGKAVHYLEEMVVQGNYTATCLLAYCLIIGLGTEKDENRAVELLYKVEFDIKGDDDIWRSFVRELGRKDKYLYGLIDWFFYRTKQLECVHNKIEQSKGDFFKLVRIAEAMKFFGFSVNFISQTTGLTIEGVESYKEHYDHDLYMSRHILSAMY